MSGKLYFRTVLKICITFILFSHPCFDSLIAFNFPKILLFSLALEEIMGLYWGIRMMLDALMGH